MSKFWEAKSQYFGKIPDILGILSTTARHKNRRKLCKLFTVWFPKGVDDLQILLGFENLFSTSDLLRKITNLSTNFDDFLLQSPLESKVS